MRIRSVHTLNMIIKILPDIHNNVTENCQYHRNVKDKRHDEDIPQNIPNKREETYTQLKKRYLYQLLNEIF